MRLPTEAAGRVEALLRERARRGVFRSFAASQGRGGRRVFTFVWLKERPLRLRFDPARGVLEFRHLLPEVPARSALYRDLRAFLKQRQSPRLPAHRRVDPKRATVRCRNRSGSVSVSLETLDGDLDYLTTKALKLVNEIFLGFLKGPYYEYMAAHFDEPEE